MRIIAACMASNEADIVEVFVRHNAALLDALVVIDHASIDATPRILAGLAEEGFKLVVLRDNDRAFRQDVRQTWLARCYLAHLDADYCLLLDADELVRAPSRAALERSLLAISPEGAGVVLVQNYVGPATAFDAAAGDANPIRRLTHRMGTERLQRHKAVVPRAFAGDAALHVSAGNHAVVRVADGAATPVRHVRLEDVTLAHFPVRSPEQVARKALLGWLSHRLAMPPGSGAQLASHWRGIFQGLAHGELDPGEALVRRAIALYAGPEPDGTARDVDPAELVADALPTDYALRYTDPRGVAPLAALATWADQLVAEIKSPPPPPPAAATRA